ncbi:nucleotidyltransferase [Gorillibacterium sp. CAU 1737]|uniref:nucleotidyltransferase n=1 Tax=Gorillibacterium sp. CAU 1737 TaxID=3140362 RepID=UPI0032602212
MTELEQAELRERFLAAVDSFIGKIKDDPNVLAVIVGGSLAYDVIWEKSDVDMTVVVRDQTLKRTSYSIIEDGITLNVSLVVRSEFRRLLDQLTGGSFFHSYLSKSKMVYTTDDSLANVFEEMKVVGRDDMALSAMICAGELISLMEKTEKWLTVRKDPQYAQYYVLKAAEALAHMELRLMGEPSSRESIQKVMKTRPELLRPFYEEPMTHFLTEEEIREKLNLLDNYLVLHLDVIARPVLEFMADQEIKTLTQISKWFHNDGHFLVLIFDYLVEKGIIEKVGQTIRITPKSKLAVEEIGYLYIPIS